MKQILFVASLVFFFFSKVQGQNIALNEGEEYVFRHSEYSDNRGLFDDESSSLPGLDKAVTHGEGYQASNFHLKVLKVFKDHYQVSITFTPINAYRRVKTVDRPKWITKFYYQKDILNTKPIDLYSCVFDLSDKGVVSNVVVLEKDSLIGGFISPKLDFSRFFFPIKKSVRTGQVIKRQGFAFDYKVIDKQNGLIRLSKTEKDNDIGKTITESLLVNENGIVVEQAIYTNTENLIGDTGNTLNRMQRLNLVNEFQDPFHCAFEDNKVEKDSVFQNTNIRIRGKIKGLEPNQEISLNMYERLPNAFHSYKIKSVINADGSFELRANVENPGSFSLQIKKLNIPIYLLQGDDLYLEFDIGQFEQTFQVSGIGASHFNFMFDKRVFEKEEDLDIRVLRKGIYDQLLDLNPDEMKKRSYDIISKKLDFLEKYRYQLPGEVYLAEYWTYYTSLVNVLYEYPRNLQYFKMKGGKMPDEFNEEKYFDFDSLVHPDNDLMAFAHEYEHFIRFYVYFVLHNKIEELTGVGYNLNHGREKAFYSLEYQSRYQLASSSFSGLTEQTLKYKTIENALQSAEWHVFESLYFEFREEYPNSVLTRLLDDAYHKSKSVQPGQIAYNFELRDFEDNKVSLSDFRGKVVYLHFWDPNCCHVYLDKYGQKMDSLFKGKNIEIIYIALDTDVKAAKKYFEGLEIRGPKLYTSKKEQHHLMDKYYFNKLSHFIIIDTEGYIFDIQAPTPQSILQNPELLYEALDPG